MWCRTPALPLHFLAHAHGARCCAGIKTDAASLEAPLTPSRRRSGASSPLSPASPWGDAGLGSGSEALCGAAEALPVVWAACSRPGNDPLKRQKENQDAYCVHDKFAGQDQSLCVCVYDGHGPNGALASGHVTSCALSSNQLYERHRHG